MPRGSRMAGLSRVTLGYCQGLSALGPGFRKREPSGRQFLDPADVQQQLDRAAEETLFVQRH